MFKLEIEFRNKQKRTVEVQTYLVGATILALEYEKDINIEYLNLRDISTIHAVGQGVRVNSIRR